MKSALNNQEQLHSVLLEQRCTEELQFWQGWTTAIVFGPEYTYLGLD